MKKSEYYLVLSVLNRYKNIDVAVEAFRGNGRQLIIAGDGPDRARLEALAQRVPNIRFEGRVSNQRKTELMRGARGFIFPSVEDFGITPIEAMSAGTPVIALRAGGLKETVTEGVSGHFFDEPSAKALGAAVKEFEKQTWDPVRVASAAGKYSKEAFIKNLDAYVEEVTTTP